MRQELDAPIQLVQTLSGDLHKVEADYQRAAVALDNAAIEHALHQQAIGTFLARHFRDLNAEAVPDEQPRAPRMGPADESLASGTGAGEGVMVLSSRAGAGWGPKSHVSYLVTTEGQSATYELPHPPQKPSNRITGVEEYSRYTNLEAAAQVSARSLESAVISERCAWEQLRETISANHATKDIATDGERTMNHAMATGSLHEGSSVALGLSSVTALSIVVGCVFVRRGQRLTTTEPRVVNSQAQLTAWTGLPVIGSLPAPAGLIAESKRRLNAIARRRTRFDNARFAAEAVVGGVFVMWAMLALLQPGFAKLFFSDPARAAIDFASWL